MTTTQLSAAPRLSTLSIVLPCFNEAANVEHAVAQARQAAEHNAEHYEVIVVDDGSTDDTLALARALAEHDVHVHVVAHEHNRGYGAAVRSGIDASHGEWILLTDADLQFDLAELEHFVPLAAGHDLVAGHRLDRADPPLRRLSAYAWNRLMRHTFGVHVRDVDCAFKLLRGSAARALPLSSDGAMISTELLVRGDAAGWRVAEVGVQHRPRTAGESSGGDLRVIARAFRERRALLRRLRAETERAPEPRRPLTA